MRNIIAAGLKALNLSDSIPPDSAEKLEYYGYLLIEQNKKMNLTAITDPQAVATLHMLDCTALLNCGTLQHARLIDVGTGAGFPGMVLKILCPCLKLTLLDSLQKRLDWLRELSQQLELADVEILHQRAEEAGQNALLREQFDFATARAVADLRILSELCLPFVKVNGRFLAMKSVGAQTEVDHARKSIEILGGKMLDPYDYTIPCTDVAHRVVIIEKTAHTPAQFPRRWSRIEKAPL